MAIPHTIIHYTPGAAKSKWLSQKIRKKYAKETPEETPQYCQYGIIKDKEDQV
jgi:hypothetical protein